MASLGRKFTIIIVSAILAFLILLVGQSAWGLLLVLNFKTNPRAVPWSVAVMAVVLYLMWEYLGGRWCLDQLEKDDPIPCQHNNRQNPANEGNPKNLR